MRKNTSFQSIYRKGDTIFIRSLTSLRNVSSFLRETRFAFTKAGYEYINLDLKGVNRIFPNACTPISAIIYQYRQDGYEINLRGVSNHLRKSNFDNPLEPTEGEIENGLFSKVWMFTNPQQIALLTESYQNSLTEKIECEKGVVDAFAWCLNEMMDNVLQHATSNNGFVMVQVHPETKMVAVCLVDLGIGILESLKNSNFNPKTSIDAITLAMKEGVTRSSELHQGNGLWGLDKIIGENNGTLTVRSGDASVFHTRQGDVRTHNFLPYFDNRKKGTIVDFQLNTSKIISLSKALSGHEPISLRLESFENDFGDIVVKVKERSQGTGTRIAAEQLRNIVVNLINEQRSKVTIDFDGIAIISSSFADELVGKLVVKYGFYNFQRIIELVGMNENVQVIVHRAVAQRMMESLKPNQSIDLVLARESEEIE